MKYTICRMEGFQINPTPARGVFLAPYEGWIPAYAGKQKAALPRESTSSPG